LSILFATYADKIWCDVFTKDVSHIILGRPWLYDRDVIIYERPNSCSFVYEGKKIKLAPLRPGSPPAIKQTEASSSKKTLIPISPKLIDKEIAKGSTVVALAREVTDDSQEHISPAAIPILREVVDVFSEELPDSLPPICDIQHAIVLVPGSSLPNLPYIMNPAEHAELKQVDELLNKGVIKKSLSLWLCRHC